MTPYYVITAGLMDRMIKFYSDRPQDPEAADILKHLLELRTETYNSRPYHKRKPNKRKELTYANQTPTTNEAERTEANRKASPRDTPNGESACE